MARQEQSCWRCGAQWVSETPPPTTLRVIEGDATLESAPAVAAASG
jgi:hypothetical protein